jgi:hypothetical protein
MWLVDLRGSLCARRLSGVKLLLGAALGIALGGCGVFGEPFQPMTVPAQKSVVYIYRPFHIAGYSNVPLVTCGQESVELEPGKYHVFMQESGPVGCSGPGETTALLNFEAEPGDQYFVKEEVSAGGKIKFTLVSASAAQPEIASCVKEVTSNP